MSKNEYTPSNKNFQPEFTAQWIRRLYCGMLPDYKKARLVAVLQAFIDDSNDRENFFLGGFVAPIDVWEEFTTEWDQACKADPRIRYYRTYDANRNEHCFRKLSREETIRKTAKLASIIPNKNCYGISICLPLNDYHEIMKQYSFKVLVSSIMKCNT